MTMKFAMYEFCEDSSCDVGESHWMIGEDDSSFNNNDWVMETEVLVRWPVQPKDYSKWANKHGKFPLDLGCTTKTYAARVLKFHDDYNCLCEVMKNYLSTGTTQTPSRGRGQRNGKKNDHLVDRDDEEPLEAPAKKQKIAKRKVTNSMMSREHITMLKEKVRGKQSKDFFEGNSSQSSDDESGSEVNKMRREIYAKDKEIESLKRQIADMKDMQNLQDIVTQLKHSVGTLDQLASAGFKCKQQGIGAPDRIEDNSKRPSSPTVTIVNKASSSDSEPDSVTQILLCPGVEINKGQKKVLSGKLSAKDFVYSALPMIWSREVLCTHSVTGRKSNAHKEREAKPQLDAEKVDSFCCYVAQKFGVTQKDVRNLMTTKINNVIKCCKQQKVVEQKND